MGAQFVGFCLGACRADPVANFLDKHPGEIDGWAKEFARGLPRKSINVINKKPKPGRRKMREPLVPNVRLQRQFLEPVVQENVIRQLEAI
jgi:hypothetical protein